MSMQFTITYGAVTLDMMADGYMLLDGFFPEAGSDPEKTTDKFNLLIRGTSRADVVAKIRAIELALEWARRHPDGPEGVYLNFAPDATLDAGRSRILDGVVMLDARLDRNMRRNKANVSVAVERVNWWEGAEAQVPLSNDNGTDDLTGLPIFNCNDLSGSTPAVRTNVIEIAGADVEGDLPGATRLELLNTYNDSKTLGWIWIGQGWEADNIQFCIEGEDSTTGSEITISTASGGAYRRFALGQDAEAEMFTWALSTAFLNACKGSIFKLLSRWFISDPTNVTFKLTIKDGIMPVWISSPFMLEADKALLIRDLYTLRMPPWLQGASALKALTLVLSGKQSNWTSQNIDLDFLYLTPADGWRSAFLFGGAAYGERLIDDGINEQIYMDDGGDNSKIGAVTPQGQAIQLYPGKDQRLFILQHSNYGDIAEIDRSLAVKLFYRPRWRSI